MPLSPQRGLAWDPRDRTQVAAGLSRRVAGAFGSSAPYPRQKVRNGRAPLSAPCPTFLLPAASPSFSGAADAARWNAFPEGEKGRPGGEKDLFCGGGAGRLPAGQAGRVSAHSLKSRGDPRSGQGPPTLPETYREAEARRRPSETLRKAEVRRHRPETLREAERGGARAARVSGGRCEKVRPRACGRAGAGSGQLGLTRRVSAAWARRSPVLGTGAHGLVRLQLPAPPGLV